MFLSIISEVEKQTVYRSPLDSNPPEKLLKIIKLWQDPSARNQSTTEMEEDIHGSTREDYKPNQRVSDTKTTLPFSPLFF